MKIELNREDERKIVGYESTGGVVFLLTSLEGSRAIRISPDGSSFRESTHSNREVKEKDDLKPIYEGELTITF